MRCSGWSSLAISVCSALALAAPAGAHVIPIPATLPSQSTQSIELAGPNERDDPMTGFKVTAPSGLEIEHAHEVAGWTVTFDRSSATWSGGALAPNDAVSFGVTLKAAADPGVLVLTTDQLYWDGPAASWPVAITVTPAEETPSENLALAAVVGIIGLLAVVAIVMLARRRRAPRAQGD